MSTFSCPVVRIASVEDHFNADRLSIIKLEGLGYLCVSAKMPDGSPRYKVGDLVVYIPSAAVLPEWLLREMGFWNADTGKGMLAGAEGNRVKPLKLRGVFSEGVLYPAQDGWEPPKPVMVLRETGMRWFEVGEDASEHLGITKYEPPIPAHMAGEVANMFGNTIRYDFERMEDQPDLFDPLDQVTATEKLHGSCIQIRYVPGMNHPDMFGESGDILVTSKNRAAAGLAFKNNTENDHTIYVQVLRDLIASGFEQRLITVINQVLGNMMQLEITTPVPITLIGEVYGKGVQDLHYGTSKPELAVFDIQVGDAWLPRDVMAAFCAHLGVTPVPVLYAGPFDVVALEAVRDGASTLGGGHVREGIVIRHAEEIPHALHGRKICKWISPAYLLRKGVKGADVTEYT